MCKSRNNFLEVLKNHFQDEAIKKKYQSSSYHYFKSNITTRVFNDFPQLLNQAEFDNHCKNFLKIFINIKSAEIRSDDIIIAKEKERNLIKNWTKEIILLSVSDLLDGEGNIKFQLLDLLNWQHIPYCYESNYINDIVCSYVATVNEQVMVNASQKIRQNGTTYAAVCFYINKNYETWVAEAIAETQKPKDYASSAYSYVESLLTDEKYNQENFKEFISSFIKLEIVSRSRQIVYLWLEIMFQVAISKQRFDIFSEIFSVTSTYIKDMELDPRQTWQYHYCTEYKKQRSIKECVLNMDEQKTKESVIVEIKSEDVNLKIQPQAVEVKSELEVKPDLQLQVKSDPETLPVTSEKNAEPKELKTSEQITTIPEEKDYVIVQPGGPSEEMPLPSYSGMIAYGFSFFKQIYDADIPGKIYNSMPAINYFSGK